MSSISLTGKVLVSIVSAIVQVSPPEWHIEYELHNLREAAIWLVVDDNLVLRHDSTHIELSFARGKMQPGVHVFGYFNPSVVMIPPGGKVSRTVEINWPCRLSDIWNAEREASPLPGEYEVSLRVGFALTEAPKPPEGGEDVETPVLRWQEEVVSAPVHMVIPTYMSPDSGGDGSR